jgi:hypothetical protein
VQLLRNLPPAFPRLGVLETWSGFPYTLRTYEEALYLATYNGVDVYDISDPQSPHLVNTLLGGHPCYGLDLRDGRLYVKGQGEGGQFLLSSFSLADPFDPEPRAQQATAPSYMQGMCTRDGVLFSIEGVQLASYDISQPGAIVPLGSMQLASMSFLVTASQEAPLLVVNDFPQGARLLNVSDPGAIAPLPPLWDSPIVGVSVDWAGARLAISSGDPGLILFDLSDPLQPSLSHRIDHGGGIPEGLATCGGVLAAAYHGGIVRLLDGAGQDELPALGRIDDFRGLPLLAASGSRLAVGDSLGIQLMEIAETGATVELADLPTEGRPASLALQPGWLASADPFGSLRVWSLADPGAPVERPSLTLPGSGTPRLLASGNELVALRGTALRVYDVEESLQERATYTLASPAHSISIDGDRLLVLDGTSNLHLFDLATETGVALLASLPAPGAHGISLEAGWVSIQTTSREWQLLDLRDPSQPLWSGSSPAQSMLANGLARAGHSLYTSSSTQGLGRLRNTLANHAPVWQPLEPVSFGEDGSASLSLAGRWQDLDLDHPVLAVQQGHTVGAVLAGSTLTLGAPADWNGQDTLGLSLQDGYSPEATAALLPVTVWAVNDAPRMESCSSPCNTVLEPEDLPLLQVSCLDVDGDSLDLRWFADGELFLEVRVHPEDLGQCQDLPLEWLPQGAGLIHAEVWDGPLGANVDGDLCSWTLQATGVTDRLLPESWQLSAPAPNPFNPETRFELTLGRGGPVTLSVYDLLGRKVDTLWQGPLAAGVHGFRWNGQRQASGIYLLVLEGQGGRLVQRMTLLK